MYIYIYRKGLYVIAGFAGEETNDIFYFDLEAKTWTQKESSTLRPRSVCASAALTVQNETYITIFGGEVDPSALGHAGAGGFANDTIAYNVSSGTLVTADLAEGSEAPPARGWACASKWTENSFIVVGGLAGSDEEPVRLGDVWKCEIIG